MKKRWIFLVIVLFLIIIAGYFLYKYFTNLSLSPPSMIVNGSVIIYQSSEKLFIEIDNSALPQNYYIKLEDRSKNTFVKEFIKNNLSDSNQFLEIKYTNLSEVLSTISIFEKNDETTSPPIEIYNVKKSDYKEISCFIDGVKDDNEECDDNNANDNDDCLNNCKKSSCGDGYINDLDSSEYEEECDGSQFGIYGNGKNQCEKYSSRYGNGSLGCNICKINTQKCTEVFRILRFDGVDDSILIKNIKLDGNKEYSVSYWIKTYPTSYEINKLFDCNNFSVSLQNDEWYLDIRSSNNPLIVESVSSDKTDYDSWQFLVFTYDPNKIQIYLNNIKIDEKKLDLKMKSNPPECKIGSSLKGIYFFNGSIDDFRIYNKTLLDKEINLLYNRDQNNETFDNSSILWYKFDEGFGSTVEDHSDNSYDGSLSGNPNWIVEETTITSFGFY